jgi:protein-L-isoaspartate(D-aspartate) O-methyltransferase
LRRDRRLSGDSAAGDDDGGQFSGARGGDVSDLERARRAYADDIARTAGLTTGALIEGLATVRREDFLGPGPWKILDPSLGAAYRETDDDNPVHLQARVLVAIDAERLLNNGDPASIASWLDQLGLSSGDRFLHVGCGVGYYTAVAATAVAPAGEAIGIEIDSVLAARAADNLARIPCASTAPSDTNFAELGPFDAVFINAGATRLACTWLDALAPGGRLLMPLTVDGAPVGIGFGQMLLVQRRSGDWPCRFVSPVGIFHCVGVRDATEEQALRSAFNAGGSEEVCALRFDPHQAEADCWLHAPKMCLSQRSPVA